MESIARRPVIVSNRLPYVIRRDADGRYSATPGSGGLVAAILPVLRDRGGTWIGWSGLSGGDDGLQQALDRANDDGFALHAVPLSADEVGSFHHDFANEVVWPLFHDLASLCNFAPAYWQSYLQVNRRFAKAVLEAADDPDLIRVHDYQLMHVCAELRRGGHAGRIAVFLHIPFPPVDLFMQLPWRRPIARAGRLRPVRVPDPARPAQLPAVPARPAAGPPADPRHRPPRLHQGHSQPPAGLSQRAGTPSRAQ
jgi:trehalose 6-phosphate synthase